MLRYLFRSEDDGEFVENCQFTGDLELLKPFMNHLYENFYAINDDTAVDTIALLAKLEVNIPLRFCELVDKYENNEATKLKKQITKLEEKVKEQNDIIVKMASNVSSMAVMKIKECRDEIVDAQTQMFQSMDNCFKFVSIPMTVSSIIVPLARRFLDWRIGYTNHEGNGAAYVGVNEPDEEYEYGLIIWRSIADRDAMLHIVCDVEKGFRLNGWTSNETAIPENQGFDGLVAIYQQLKVEAPIFLQALELQNQTPK